MRQLLSVCLIAAIALGPVTPAFAAEPKTATPIKHIVIIFGENESFDHYFGTYPTALNPKGEPQFHALAGTPSVNGLSYALLNNNPNLNPVNGNGASNPFRVDRSQAATQDMNHDYTPEQLAFDGGAMDLFPANTGFPGPPPSGPPAIVETTGLVMGYYDGNTVTALWNYAQHFAMSDNVGAGEPVLVEWVNSLPAEHFLPIDHTIHGAEPDKPAVRTVVHLHGAKTRPESDGYPEDWIVPGKSAVHHYPNQQDAAMLWYHDHALGINRLNVYAGLLGAFFIRDGVEDALGLPQGEYELPLIIYDRLLTREGQLLYPVSPDPESPWVPEVFGNAILVNGKLFPYLEVTPRKYRFRLLNASNARMYHLSIASGAENIPFHQIGTDQGLLAAPVPLTQLEIAPGERADLIVDFSQHKGAQLVLKSEAFVVMQFRVSVGKVEDASSLPAVLRAVPKLRESQAVQTRLLTLNEYVNKAGNSAMLLLNATHWKMPVTEKPVLGSTEIWTLINPTNDTHPIHLHLVRFQILDRQPYEPWLFQTKRQLHFLGPAQPPDANEAGWKDTVQAHSLTVTRIIVPFEGFVGRYVWHCHILEHEDNEMMRPYEVVAAG